MIDDYGHYYDRVLDAIELYCVRTYNIESVVFPLKFKYYQFPLECCMDARVW